VTWNEGLCSARSIARMGGVVQVLYNSNITDDKLEVQDLRFQDSMEATSLLQRSYLQSLVQRIAIVAVTI
jgi:hypothetical protein